MICAICGGPYERHGNNAAPFAGRCCDDCDNRFVTPARMFGVADPDLLALLQEFAKHGRLLVRAAAVAAAMRRDADIADNERLERWRETP